MGTRYIIKAKQSDGSHLCTLTRQTRMGAYRAADTLMDGYGEETEIRIKWEMNSGPSGTFEYIERELRK